MMDSFFVRKNACTFTNDMSGCWAGDWSALRQVQSHRLPEAERPMVRHTQRLNGRCCGTSSSYTEQAQDVFECAWTAA